MSLRTKAGFTARVVELRRGGMAPEYIARQITDDLYRETQDPEWAFKQHIIETLVYNILADSLNGTNMKKKTKKRKFPLYEVKVAKGLTRKDACRRAIRKLRKDVRGCTYNAKTGLVKLR